VVHVRGMRRGTTCVRFVWFGGILRGMGIPISRDVRGARCLGAGPTTRGEGLLRQRRGVRVYLGNDEDGVPEQPYSQEPE
jgi:hypothetical protein